MSLWQSVCHLPHFLLFSAVHILQRFSRCEWDEETEEVNGFHQYGYDGEDFLTFNLETQTWIATKPQAVITKHLWDKDKFNNDFWKKFLKQVCVDCLKMHMSYGRSFLLRRGKLTYHKIVLWILLKFLLAYIKIVITHMLPASSYLINFFL